MNRIYFVRHPDPGRAEPHHGIDFHSGKGSSGCWASVLLAVRHDCRLEDPADQAAAEAAIAAEDKDRAECRRKNAEIEKSMEEREGKLHDSRRTHIPGY